MNLSQPSQSAGAQSQTDINIDGIDEDDIGNYISIVTSGFISIVFQIYLNFDVDYVAAPNLVEDIRNMMLALSDQMRGGMLSERYI